MNTLDPFFQNSEKPNHPKIASWAIKLNDNPKHYCEIYRKREGLSFQPAKIYLHIVDPDGKQITDQDDWDTDLNQFLIEKEVCAVTPKNEQIRFALMLKQLFKKPEIRYGDGYFNAVLMELVVSAFKEQEGVKEILAYIPSHSPNKGDAYPDCKSMIEGAIGMCAKYLLDKLHYERHQAELILAGAMGEYLDERFSVTNRKRLGMA